MSDQLTLTAAGPTFDPQDIGAALQLAESYCMAYCVTHDFDFAVQVFEFGPGGAAARLDRHKWEPEGVAYQRPDGLIAVDFWSGPEAHGEWVMNTLTEAVSAIAGLHASASYKRARKRALPRPMAAMEALVDA